jgi:hypothetical protein
MLTSAQKTSLDYVPVHYEMGRLVMNKDESMILFFCFNYIESTISSFFYISRDYTLIVESVLLGGVGIESSGIML